MRSDIFWSGLEAGFAGALSVISAFFIARVIGPSEVGSGAAAVAIHVVLWVATNALFADAIPQRRRIGPVTLSSAFWAGVLAGCAASLIQVVSGWMLAWLYDDPRLGPMGILLALPLPLVGAAGTVQGLLIRRRAYRTLAMRTVLGLGSATAVGMTLAGIGAGAWAIVWQQAFISAGGAIVLLVGAQWRPDRTLRWTAVRGLLAVGLPLTVSTLTQIGRYRLFAILIGCIAGTAVLGQVHIAFRLVDTVRDLVFTALWRLFLPDLARFQRDPTAMLARVDRLLRATSLSVLPLCLLLSILLGPFVTVFLGPAWQPVSSAAQPLVALMALMTVMFPAGAALIAVGRARHTLYGNLLGLGTCFLMTAMLRPETVWQAVLVWCISPLLVLPYALWVNGKALGVGPLRPLRAGVFAGMATIGLIVLLLVPRLSGT